MQGYEEIFNQRGKSYQLAMEKYPEAREAEFQATVRRLRQIQHSTILDLPAGGGYLQKYLKDNINYLAYDFSGEFNDNHNRIQKCRESRIELEDESVDEIVSLAALHHILARKEFYSEMYRVLKPGGRLIIGDATTNSKLDKFLNGFLDEWNSMGHNGRFIAEGDLLEIAEAGFRTDYVIDKYQWNFSTQNEALDFFRLLFCLDRNPPEEKLLDALQELGVHENDGFSVSWELGFITCEK
ncbi:class I SAM-dependent methyltransferase [Ekhidna sp.]|uniref:class I SAM-dependent methyltransferase n=1 Tax=Ekhidna sp. TaxID=2608089 RepID=UPI0035156EB1